MAELLNLFPQIIHDNDLSPESAGEEIDGLCTEIYEACKGWGTDEDRLVMAIGSTTAETRCKIAVRFPELYDGKDLRSLLKSECGGDFGVALQFMAVPTDEMECNMIVKACKGMGTNELILYPILCGGRTNDEIQILKRTFFKTTDRDLGQYLDSELGGDLEKLFFTCLQAAEEDYDPDYHNDELIEKDIEELYDAGSGTFGTDEQALFKVLVGRPPEYLKPLNLAYAEKHGYTLLKVLEKELGGQVRDAALYMLGMKLKPFETVAKLIKKSCAGFGTDELLLTCCLLRYQPYLKAIDEAHIELFEKTIADRVESEVGGDYKKLLLAVLNAAD